MSKDTIVAIATPPGRGGIGIVRVSGPLAYRIGLTISRQTELTIRKAIYTDFFNESGVLIDQGLIIYFKGPNSFTGEDIIEFQGHGAPIVLDCLLASCLHNGGRIARPGEFSERAFLNDKIDLAQAEAIADLIHASSLTAARMALRSLQGDFSKRINAINEQILRLRIYVEAAIDFPEEEIDFLNDGVVISQIDAILENLKQIQADAKQGSMLREGLSIVIAGPPNAGKSTLMNQLAGKEVAIVTEIAGTTRDVMREYVLMDELPIHFIDTAGLRESEDLVEKEGIKRAWEEVKKADCLLLLSDINHQDCPKLHQNILSQVPAGIPLIRVYNKVDTLQDAFQQEKEAVYISAKIGTGIQALKTRIKSDLGYQPTEGQFLARRRHIDALERAFTFLLVGKEQLAEHKAGELLAEDLRAAHQALSEITGEFSSDDLLGAIFSTFCIGK